MAFLALRAETTLVDVVRCVAGAADHGGLRDGLRSDVALPAANVRVGACQRKPGARRMIEVPEFPAVGRVAGATVLAQLSLVDVLFRMAAYAGLWCFLGGDTGSCVFQARCPFLAVGGAGEKIFSPAIKLRID